MGVKQPSDGDTPDRQVRRTIQLKTHVSETIEKFDPDTSHLTRRTVRSKDTDATITEEDQPRVDLGAIESGQLRRLPTAGAEPVLPDLWQVSIFDSGEDAPASIADFSGDYMVSRVRGSDADDWAVWESVFDEWQGLSRLRLTARLENQRLLLAVELIGQIQGPRWTGVASTDLRRPLMLQRDRRVPPAEVAENDWPASVSLLSLGRTASEAGLAQSAGDLGVSEAGGTSGYYISPEPSAAERAMLGGASGSSCSSSSGCREPVVDPTPPCEEAEECPPCKEGEDGEEGEVETEECCDCGCSDGPIRYFNGEVQLSVTDLAIKGYGSLWGQQRVYSNRLTPIASTGNGISWLVKQWPYLVESDDFSIVMVKGTRQALWFDPAGTDYAARYGAKSTLVHDAANQKFILSQPSGEQWLFHDFDQTAHPPGIISGHIAAGGQTTDIASYTTADLIQEITRSVVVGGQTITASFLYDYTSGDQLRSVIYRKQVDAGAWTEIRRVLYEYYGSSAAFGNAGDLKRSRVQVPSGSGWLDTETRYYRYYTSNTGTGFQHGLKFVLNPASYNRMVDDSLDPLVASDAQLAGYADFYYEYDGQRRATREILDAGSRSYTFAYTTSSFADDYNHWKVKTVETLPDSTQNIVYTNYIGQILIKEYRSDSGRWIEYHQFSNDGRKTLSATPAAVIDYDDEAADLDVELRTATGEIRLTQYYTATGGVEAKGYVKARKIQQGASGTPITLQTLEYTSRTAAGATVFPVSKSTAYPNQDGTGAIETTYAYQWYAGTVQQKQRTVTLPVVSTSHNGSGVAATRKSYFDQHGYATWATNERGYIARHIYDVPTGSLIKRIQDVDTSLYGDVPAGWTTPADGGRNLVTDYTIDDLGRQTQMLGPVHTIDLAGTATPIRTAQWTDYLDSVYTVRTGRGYQVVSDSTFTLVNPVGITVANAGGQVVQQIQATRGSGVSSPGKLLSTDSFPQSSYTAWTTTQYIDCCIVAGMRVYKLIPASGEGLSGTNYDQTSYGYDVMKRRNRTVTPGGTITFNVLDDRGLTTQSWTGTDDAGASSSDPSGGGAPGNNMVLVTAMEYDDGGDGGNGNLTKVTQYVDDTTTRVTQYLYDWRNRQTATEGELDFYQQQFHDNLARVVMTERRDGSASGQLLSRDETLYDNRGRVYRAIRYGVDPSTGSVTGQQTQDRFYDQGHNLLRQEPAGAMEYQEFEYDSLGQRVAEIDPLEHSRLFVYDAAGNMVSLTDPNEEVWTRGYDPLGRRVRSTNPLAESTTYGYSAAGQQTTVTNALNETTTTTFDAAGRRVGEIDPLGKITSYTFDANGNQTSVTDPNNLTTVSQYDYLDRLIKVTDPLNDSVQYAYNRAGELVVETDAKDQETTHGYDALGRRIATTDRLNQTTTFAWNALGLQASLTDAENQTTSYVYDEYLRLYQTIWPDHVSPSNPGDADYGITQTEYDSLNRVLRTTDQLGDTVTHNHDAAGRLLSRDYRTAANSPSGTIADSDTFTYDASSKLLTAASGRYSNTVTLAYDAAGRQTSNSLTISGQTYVSTTQYDAAGRVSKLVYPDGSEVSRGYTARGQLASIAVDSTTIDTRLYDNGGRMTSSSYNNGVGETRAYNDDNTLASISYSGAAIGDLSYGWDANKNKTSETIGGVMSGYGFTAGYDAEDRLTSWDRADTNLDQSWDLSPVGDWNSITENSSVQNRTHGPVHEILTAASESVQHDPKGNMTLIPPVLRPGSDPLKLKWDFDNKLRAADTDDDGIDDVFYRWDALGRRVGRDDGTNHTIYFQDGQQTLADYPAGTAAASPTYTYVYGSYIDEVVLRSGGSGVRYYHRNQQYSITALTDGGGSIVERYAYTAYGQVTFTDASGTVQTASASNNRYTYTGREWDQGLSLYHYRARMYDAVAGRFVSRDPIGFQGSKWLLYAYLNASPAAAADPSGTQAVQLFMPACCEYTRRCKCGSWFTGSKRWVDEFTSREHNCRAEVITRPDGSKTIDYNPRECCESQTPYSLMIGCTSWKLKTSAKCRIADDQGCKKLLEGWIGGLGQGQGSKPHADCMEWCETCVARPAGDPGSPIYGHAKQICIEQVCNNAF